MKRLVKGLGALMFVCGLSGMADAVTGQGTFMVAAVVFSIGFGISLYNFLYGGERNEKNRNSTINNNDFQLPRR